MPSRFDVARRLAPFALAAVLAFALVGLTAQITDPAEYAAAAAVLALVVVAAVALPWGRLPAAAQLGPAGLFLVSAWLLRDAAGGIASGVATLALLPVFWMALNGGPRELALVLAGATVYLLFPIALIGGASYPASGYRAAVMFAVVAGIVGVTVQRLVGQVRAHSREMTEHTRDLEQVAALSRAVATSPDPRAAVCEAACALGGAAFAFLMEPVEGGGLASTAMVGLDAPRVVSAPPDQRPPTLQAFNSGEPVFVADMDRHGPPDRSLWDRHGRPASMLFQPVVRHGAPVGVLVLGWGDRVDGGRHPAIVGLLAGEAALAIARADLVEELTGLASTDPLTGVLNRRAWDARLARALAAAAGEPLSVALLDLDHFKAFNDSRGHQAGDRLLREAAARWRTLLRPGDLLARYGGEEFAVLLPSCGGGDARPILERLRAATPEGVTCSVGLAVWDGGEEAESLVGRADAGLYAAKAAGRDRLAVGAPA